MADYKKYFSSLFYISIPIIIGNIAHMLLGATDVFVAAKHSVDTLAAISIANAITMSVFIVGIGLLSGVTPVISNYRGEERSSRKYLLSTINFSLILSSFMCIITILGLPLIDLFGFEPHLLPMIKEYIFVLAFSNFGGYLHFALKEFLQAREVLAFPNGLSVVAIFLNLMLNWVFVFGFGPIPSLGVVGLAIATLLVRTIMGSVLLIYCSKLLDFDVKFDCKYIKQLLKVGYPIALALLLEFLAFNSITVLMGQKAGFYAAAQSLIMVITSMTFMVPLAISNAIAIKVGFANGARNYLDLKRYSISGTTLTTSFMSLCGVVLFFFPKEILRLMSDDTRLLNIAIPVLMVAAIFQIFDGLQVAFSGILKGLKMTKFVSMAILCGYWLLGLPLGWVLSYKFDMNLVGFWVGLAFSIFVMSLFMGIVVVHKFQKIRRAFRN